MDFLEYLTPKSEGGLTYGAEYKVIGRDKEGMFLIKDDSSCCYPADKSVPGNGLH